MPTPVLTKAPVPLIAPEKESAPVFVLVSVAEPSVTEPAPARANCWELLVRFSVPLTVTSWLFNWLAASVRSVAPEPTVKAPPIAAVLADLLKTVVPAEIVEPPEAVLAPLPLKITVPLPLLVNPPAPPITPLKASVPPEAVVNVAPWLSVMPPLNSFVPLVLLPPRVEAPPPVLTEMALPLVTPPAEDVVPR